ncbi:F-box protein [Spatholobus suberectus]|nr:F-box protein [Spatholobus suberectus]
MACTSGEPNATETGAPGGATALSDVPPDIIQTHILTRLGGPALASAATTCSQLRTLSSHSPLWANACHATWPSTLAPRVRHVISMFPNGARSFFADSFPSPRPSQKFSPHNPDRTPELISAVDLFHGGNLVLSKVVETETVTGWFRCSPFRIDLVDPKDVVPTRVKYPVDDDTCRELGEELRLSWVLIDPAARRAVDVSSGRAVAVEKHWLSGEVEVRFATAVDGSQDWPKGFAHCWTSLGDKEVGLCRVVVRWGADMQVREVSLQMEDVDGVQMNGRDSLVILQRVLEGGRKRRKEKDGGEGYREFLKRKKERKEGKARAEGRLDMLCVALAVLTTVASLFLFWRWSYTTS